MARPTVLAAAVARRAVDADVKVVLVLMATPWLHQSPIDAIANRLGGTDAATFAEQASFDRLMHKDVLHPGISVGYQFCHELPISAVVESKPFVGRQSTAVCRECSKGAWCIGPAPAVEHVERDIDVAAVLM